MLSRTAEYGILATVYLASNGASPQTTIQIAEAIHVPAPYLTKVLQSLAHAGIVRPRRGPRGGFTLRRLPCELSLLEIVDAVEPWERRQGCPLPPHKAETCCILGDWFLKVRAAVEAVLRDTYVSDFLPEARGATEGDGNGSGAVGTARPAAPFQHQSRSGATES